MFTTLSQDQRSIVASELSDNSQSLATTQCRRNLSLMYRMRDFRQDHLETLAGGYQTLSVRARGRLHPYRTKTNDPEHEEQDLKYEHDNRRNRQGFRHDQRAVNQNAVDPERGDREKDTSRAHCPK